MKKELLLLTFFAFLCCGSLHAQSTIHFFCPSLGNVETTLKINGEEIGDLRGPVKKTYEAIPPHTLYGSVIYHACMKKCLLNDEGKALFSIDITFLNAVNGDISKYASEIQINLMDGDIHYIVVSPKGLNDLELKEVSTKEGGKLLKNKKYIQLPDYISE